MQGTPPGSSVLFSVDESEYDTLYIALNLSGYANAYAEVVTLAAPTNISKVKFFLGKGNYPTGNIYAKLYAVDENHKPTGPALATSIAVDISTLTSSSSLQLVEFTFQGGYSAEAGEMAVIIEYMDGNASNTLRVGAVSSGHSQVDNFYLVNRVYPESWGYAMIGSQYGGLIFYLYN